MTVRCTPCRLYRIGHPLPEFGELCDCKIAYGTRFEIRGDTSMRREICNWFFRGRKVDLVTLDSVSLYETSAISSFTTARWLFPSLIRKRSDGLST